MALSGLNLFKLSLDPKVHIGLILFFSGIVLFHNLGKESMRALDEAKWGQISREMLRSGDWLTPRIGGRIFQHKPPLRMWLNTAAYSIFGESEFALRFWSAVSGIGILILTYLLSYILFQNSLISLASALVLLLSPVFTFEYLRMGDEHATFTFLFLLCLYFFWLGRKDKKYFYFSSIFFSLSFLTYGFGALFAPLIIFAYLIISGEIKKYNLKLATVCLLLSSSIIFPWYVYQYAVNGTNFLKIYLAEITYFFDADIIRKTNSYINFLGQNLVDKMAACIDAFFFRGPDFYVNAVRFALFPWWIPLIFYFFFIVFKSLVNLYKKAVKISKENLFILIWLVCVLSILFIFKDKRSWRLYFLFPAFGILASKSLAWLYREGKAGFPAVAFFLLIGLYNFNFIMPICRGPLCIKNIELYGLRAESAPPLGINFTPLLFLFLILLIFIQIINYILTYSRKRVFLHRIACYALFFYLFFVGFKNTLNFIHSNKGKSDIDLIVREIKGLTGISKMVICDPILYKMEKGTIVPEYSLGGAATGYTGEHRWDSYYYIDSIDIKKEYIDDLEDLKDSLANNSRTRAALLINKNTWQSSRVNTSSYLANPLLEKGDYVVVLSGG